MGTFLSEFEEWEDTRYRIRMVRHPSVSWLFFGYLLNVLMLYPERGGGLNRDHPTLLHQYY